MRQAQKLYPEDSIRTKEDGSADERAVPAPGGSGGAQIHKGKGKSKKWKNAEEDHRL